MLVKREAIIRRDARLNIRTTTDIANKVEKLANKREISKSDLIERAILEYLDRHK